MKKILVVLAVVVFSSYMFGCAKKESSEELQEQMSMETLTTMNAVAPTAPEVKTTEFKASAQVQPTVAAGLQPLPPLASKPSAIEIQTALKNAGLYTGAIDGKIGPMTKKAIEEFQKANNLQADGKVGPKTWVALSRFLVPETAPTGKR